jgi:hypothetical protein
MREIPPARESSDRRRRSPSDGRIAPTITTGSFVLRQRRNGKLLAGIDVIAAERLEHCASVAAGSSAAQLTI